MMKIARFFIFPVLLVSFVVGGNNPVNADEGSPSALVEAVEKAPDAGVAFMDYVYPGKVIELGSDGTLTLSYFDTCRTEKITGGQVTVSDGASEVEGGDVESKKFPCQGEQIVVTSETSEAGATVSRVTPFADQDWAEFTVNTPTPVFKWPMADGVTTLRILEMDSEPPKLVWEGQAQGSYFTYPADAPPLEIGLPYQVQASPPGAEQILAMFSIDPDLETPATVMARVIPLGR